MRTMWLLTLLLAGVCAAAETPRSPTLVEVRKIWDAGPHNAFTDLIRFQDRWWCCFRESAGHVGGDGKIRVITSADGRAWDSAALLEEKDVDLRDPKFSIAPPEGPQGAPRLMMVLGGSIYLGTTQLKGRQPRVTFSTDGRTWTTPRRVLAEGDWLWRVTWHDGVAYGASYAQPAGAAPAEWSLKLYRSRDGLSWELVSPLEVSGRPNETTLRFLKTGEMMALVRREAGSTVGWIGVSRPPYTRWSWQETGHRLGGPNFIELPDGTLWAGTRAYGKAATFVIARMDRAGLEPVLTLPSGGDTSYPGLVWHEGVLWVSYYSSHEGKTNIYLAKVRV